MTLQLRKSLRVSNKEIHYRKSNWALIYIYIYIYRHCFYFRNFFLWDLTILRLWLWFKVSVQNIRVFEVQFCFTNILKKKKKHQSLATTSVVDSTFYIFVETKGQSYLYNKNNFVDRFCSALTHENEQHDSEMPWFISTQHALNSKPL